MQQISYSKHPVYIGKASGLPELCEMQKFDQVFLLGDSNTSGLCIPKLGLNAPVIQVAAGEENKTLASATYIWNELLEKGASRRSLLVNTGGGMLTDLGAFSASLYMRGISFIQVPTSLLAMVDASIGGKTAVDLHSHKNTVGTFAFPELVLIDPDFLQTLTAEQVSAGKAEMLKHGLVADYAHAMKVAGCEIPDEKLIADSIRIKIKLVEKDTREQAERKLLNFGHSFGHAFEGLSLARSSPVLHGYAVAAGMVCEAYLSLRHGLGKEQFDEICGLIRQTCPKLSLNASFEELMNFMRSDKKNHSSKLLFTLLAGPGHGIFDVECDESQLREAFTYYQENYQA